MRLMFFNGIHQECFVDQGAVVTAWFHKDKINCTFEGVDVKNKYFKTYLPKEIDGYQKGEPVWIETKLIINWHR